MTIKIYKCEMWDGPCLCNHSMYASLSPWQGDSFECCGQDNGGRLYALPDKIKIGKGEDGQYHFYDDKDGYCELVVENNGDISLIGGFNVGTVILKEAA